jgi:hypothetical protein
MALGPVQMPPQGARSLVGSLLGGRRRRAEVSATLDESDPGNVVIEFFNDDREPAIGLRYVFIGADGDVSSHAVGTLPAGAAVRVETHRAVSGSFRCVWTCEDRRGIRAWSYDGRVKRFPRRGIPSDPELVAAFSLNQVRLS